MAMQVKNNMGAVRTLNILNKNSKALSKSLAKVSSGMKINSAEDDASGYAISERMKVRIRGLDQDVENVQTGEKLVATAEGGMREILENLRSMKEMAINSANDHNTDLDRATLQREYDQRLEEINDIACTTNYNGKLLLMGEYHEPTFHLEHVDEIYTKTTTITQPSGSERGYVGADGVTYVIQKNAVSGFVDNFSAMPFTKKSGTTTSSFRTGHLSPCDVYESVTSIPAGLTTEELERYAGRQGVKMDFTGASFNGVSLDSLDFTAETSPGSGIYGIDNGLGKICTSINEMLDEQGFIIMCAGCDQFINIRFDNDIDIADSQYNDHLTGLNVPGNSSSQNREYVVGIRDVNITDTSELAAIVFEGVGNAAGKPTTTQAEYRPVYTDADGNPHYGYYASTTEQDDENTLILDPYHSVMLKKNEKKEYYISKDDWPNIYLYDEGFNVVVEDGTDDAGTTTVLDATDPPETKTITESVRVVRDDIVPDPYQPLIIHDGTKANEQIRIFINDMRPSAMKLDGVDITTGDKARGAIFRLEDAVEYTLNEITRMGAYRMRLEQSEANLVTGSENTTASLSTIQDADMAKEMTAYTKNNVLLQAAQSMLAQANQSASNVLSLLQ